MSSIDNRVVQMVFDNAKFEAGIQKSMKSLQNLDESLKLKNSGQSLDNVEAKLKKLDFSAIGSAVESISLKFSNWEVAAVTAIAHITEKAINLAETLGNEIVLAPVKDGFAEYEEGLNSVQTIMNNVPNSMDEVQAALDELNTYADRTIYKFSDMTSAIGKFTTNSVDLDTSVAAIQGIANAAALSGANTAQASSAYYNFAQALSAGYMGLIDWKSISLTAGMATKEFKQNLIDTAIEFGTLTEAEGKYIPVTDQVTKRNGDAFDAVRGFTESLSAQWMTSEVLTTALAKYADETTELGQRAYRAATEVKSFSQLIDTAKEALGTGWAKSFEYVFGNYEEAKDMWTGISNVLDQMIGNYHDARNAQLLMWKEMGGRDTLLEGFAQAWEGVSTRVSEVSKLLKGVFPVSLLNILNGLTNAVYDFGIKLGDTSNFYRVLDKLMNDSTIKSNLRYFKDAFEAIKSRIKRLGEVAGLAGLNLDSFGGFFSSLIQKMPNIKWAFHWIHGVFDGLEWVVRRVADAFGLVTGIILNVSGYFHKLNQNADETTNFFYRFGEAVRIVINGVTRVLDGIGAAIFTDSNIRYFTDAIIAIIRRFTQLGDVAKQAGFTMENFQDFMGRLGFSAIDLTSSLHWVHAVFDLLAWAIMKAGQFMSFLGDVIVNVVNFFNDLNGETDDSVNLFYEFGEALRAIVNGVTNFIDTFDFSKLVPAVSAVFTTVAGIIATGVNTVGNALGMGFKYVQGLVTGNSEVTGDDIVNALKSSTASAVETVQILAGNLGNGFTSGFNTARERIGEFFSDFGGFPELSGVKDAFSAFGNFFKELWAQIPKPELLVNGWKSLSSIISGAFSKIDFKSATTDFGAFTASIGNAFSYLGEHIGSWFAGIKNGFKTWRESLKDVDWKGFGSKAQSILSSVWETIKTIAGALGGFFSGLFEGAGGTLASGFTAVTGFIGTAATNLAGFFKDKFIPALGRGLSGAKDGLLGAFSSAFNFLKEHLGPRISDIFSGAGGAAEGAAGGLFSAFSSIGEKITGFFSGLGFTWDGFKEKISSVVNSIKGLFEDGIFADIDLHDVLTLLKLILSRKTLEEASSALGNFKGAIEALKGGTEKANKTFAETKVGKIFILAAALAILAASMWLISTIPEEDFGRALAGIAALAGLIAALLIISAAVTRLLPKLKVAGSKSKGIKGIFGNIANSFKSLVNNASFAMQITAIAVLVLAMAGAVLMLVGAVKSIASIDPDRVEDSVDAVRALGILVGAMTIFAALAARISGNGKLMGVIAAIWVMSKVIEALAILVVLLGRTDPVQLENGLKAVAGLTLLVSMFTVLIAVANRIGGVKMGSIIAIIAMAAVVYALSQVVQILGDYWLSNWEGWVFGMLGVAALVTLMVSAIFALNQLPSIKVTALAAIALFVAALYAMTYLVAVLGSSFLRNPAGYAGGLFAVTVLTALMIAAIKAINKMTMVKPMALAAIAVFVAALVVMAGVLIVIGDYFMESPAGYAVGLFTVITLTALILIAIKMMNRIPAIKPTTVTALAALAAVMAGMALLIGAMTAAVYFLGQMNPEQLGYGFLALLGMLATIVPVIAIIAFISQNMKVDVRGLLALSVAMGALSVLMIAMAAAIYIVKDVPVSQFVAFIASFAVAMLILMGVAFVIGKIPAISAGIISLAAAFALFGAGAFLIGMGAMALISFVEALSLLSPETIDKAVNSLRMLILKLSTLGPTILIALMALKNVAVTAVMLIISGIVEALLAGLPGTVIAIAETIVEILDILDEYGPKIATKLVDVVIDTIGAAVMELGNRIGDFGAKFDENKETLKEDAKDFLKDGVGGGVADFVNDIPEYAGSIVDGFIEHFTGQDAEGAGTKFFDSIGAGFSAGVQNVATWLSGIPETIGSQLEDSESFLGGIATNIGELADAFAAFMEDPNANKDALKEKIKEMLEGIGEAVGETVATIPELLGSIFTGFVNGVTGTDNEDFKEAFHTWLKGIATAVGEVVADIPSLVADIIDGFITGLTGEDQTGTTASAFQDIVDTMSPTFENLRDIATTITDNIGPAFEKITGFLSDMAETGVNVIGPLFDGLTDFFSGIGDLVEPAAGVIGQGLSAAGEAMSNAGDALGRGLDAVGSEFEESGDWLAALAAGWESLWNDGAQQAADSSRDSADSMKTAMADAKEDAEMTAEQLAEAMERIGAEFTSFSETATGYSEQVDQIMTDIGTSMTEGLDGIRETLNTELLDAFGEMPDQIDTSGMEAVTEANALERALVAAFQIGIQNVGKTAITELGNAFTATYATMDTEFTNTLNKVNSFLDDVASGISGKYYTIYNAASSLASAVKDAFSAKYYAMVESGKNLIYGIAEGIGNNAYLINNAMSSLATQSVDKFNQSLQINSPSKIFEHQAEFIPAGIALGIRNATGDATKAIGNSADLMVNTFNAKMSLLSESDFDATPTITPVFDLTNAKLAGNSIDSMLNTKPMLNGTFQSSNRDVVQKLDQFMGLVEDVSEKLQNGNTLIIDGAVVNGRPEIQDTFVTLMDQLLDLREM